MSNLKSFLIKKFLLPKVVLFNEPGRIISKSVKRYGNSSSSIRCYYPFEDTLIKLQEEAKKSIGPKRTNDIWYEIGKTHVLRHASFSGKKKVPEFLQEDAIKFIISVFHYSGFTVTNNLELDIKSKIIEVWGDNNCVCRSTGLGDVFAGVISGVMSYVTGQNIEAIKTSCCKTETECRIIGKPDIQERYIPTEGTYEKDKDYDRLNLKPIKQKGSTFQELIKFKKVKLEDDRYVYDKYALGLIEVGFLDLIYQKYKENNLEKEFKTAVQASGKEIFKDKNNCSAIGKVMTALGNGIINITPKGKGFKIIIFSPPSTKFEMNYLPNFLIGALKNFNPKYNPKTVVYSKISNTLRIE